MTLVASRLATSLRRRLRSSLGKRFSRFVPVAVASFVASQIALTLLLGPGHATAGLSAIAAWFTGATVSYILSRWAWERKGRPNLVKETLPFWAVSVGAAVVLTLTAKYANQEALRMGLSHPVRVLFVDADVEVERAWIERASAEIAHDASFAGAWGRIEEWFVDRDGERDPHPPLHLGLKNRHA